MRDRSDEIELIEKLGRLPLLSEHGLRVEAAAPAGIIISYRGHVRGHWHARDGVFKYTPAGYNAPTHSVRSVAEALAVMQSIL